MKLKEAICLQTNWLPQKIVRGLPNANYARWGYINSHATDLIFYLKHMQIIAFIWRSIYLSLQILYNSEAWS